MAAAPPGSELCPYCRRPFKRLRTHLPHCKAAPSPAPGSGSGSVAAGTPSPRGGSGSFGAGPAAKPKAGSKARAGKSSERPPSPSVGQGKVAAGEQGGGSSPRLPRQPERREAEKKVEPAVEDVARSLDLLPEEVKDIPEKLNNGVKIVIEKHRARVVREQSRSRSRGGAAGSHSTDQGPGKGLKPGSAAGRSDTAQPGPQEKITGAKSEMHSLGTVKNVSARLKGEKGGSSKAKKKDMLGVPPEADCKSSPGDLTQQEGIDKTMTEEKQMYLEGGAEYKAPLSALHTKSLHLSAMEGLGGHEEGTSKHYLTGIQKLRESTKQMAAVSEPILDARRDTELALDQFSLHTSKSQPICLSQASGRGASAGAVGLEWFPDLYPNYDGLSIFPGERFQEDVGIVMKAPKGSLSEGQQGPLLERRLMDVRLGELPAWLATRDISPQGLLGGVRKAWSNYQDKYINVRRGGPAGISMLLAGYCLLSYVWNYEHIKSHRWRKYH